MTTLTGHQTLTPQDDAGAVASAGLLDPGQTPEPELRLEAEALVDPLCGVIRRIVPYPVGDGAPAAFRCDIAELADTRRYAVWLSDQIAAGTSFGDPIASRRGAIGEAVERYCGNNIPAELPRASARRLRADGARLFGPDDLAGYSNTQFATPGFPYRPFSDADEILWATGIDQDGEPCLLPGSWTYLNWHQGARRGEPRHHHLNYAGVATGVGLDDAAERALLEVVERDAATLWWSLQMPATGVDVASVPGLTRTWDGSRLELSLLSLPSQFGVPVLAALVWDPLLRIPGVGFACRYDAAEAALKAAQEAIQVWIATRGLLEPDGPAFEAISRGILARHAYLPHQPGRRYLEAAGPAFENVRHLAAQAQVWLDDRLHHHLDRFTTPETVVPIHAIPASDRDALYGALRAHGHRWVTVDLTTRDVAHTPLRVARVAVSGLLPNAPAAYPYLGSGRWAQIAGSAGLTDFDTPDDSLWRVPQPHL